jgi:methylated-DNA-[protein]-cysteine S-methyltransferase
MSPLPPLDVLVLPTPAGPLAVLVTPEDDVVRGSVFGDPARAVGVLPGFLRDRGVVSAPARGPVAEAVGAYADGDVDALDAVPVQQPGGPFLQQAWGAMRAIPAGTTLTYAGLAAAVGRPAAARAAGSACARNTVAPFVPCHRVVRTDGSFGGYAFGVQLKERLLAHERGE